MKHEKSCGAIVYRKAESTISFLVVKMNLGHVSFPKGHVESGETEEQTALREVKEETNINISIREGFREVVTYSPYPGVMKDVVFFVGQATNDEVFPQEEEIEQGWFLLATDVLNLLTYESDRTVFRKALTFLGHDYEF